jgi:hypothetical protein
MYSIIGSDVVLEGRPWPRGQKIMSLTSALRAVASALILALTVLVLGLGLEGSTSGLDYKHVNVIFWDVSCQSQGVLSVLH